MEDRRKHQRYGCCSERKFIAKYENKDRMLGEVKDFSRSGISFDSKEDLNKEKEVKLDLQISGIDQKAPASIQILWSKQNPEGHTYGARFINISPESKFDIMDLLYQDWRKTLNFDSLLS
ncbi:MAG: PilZ domain-containing protein [Candidatus Omnitrophica bacterium]|nr:PilZ domain-containing protein [Candidatus Omnitrophota bacterium]